MLVCAAAAFAVAFYAAGAGQSTKTHVKAHLTKPVPFADSTARSVAASLTGHVAPLKLPPPRHVTHHAKPAVPAAPTVTPTATTSTPAYVAPTYVPPAKHKSPGTGHGVTVIGGK